MPTHISLLETDTFHVQGTVEVFPQKGDGSQFIALPAKIRKKEKIGLRDTISIHFQLRER